MRPATFPLLALALLLAALPLGACNSTAQQASAPVPQLVTITPDSAPSPSATPFQPSSESALLFPTVMPVFIGTASALPEIASPTAIAVGLSPSPTASLEPTVVIATSSPVPSSTPVVATVVPGLRPQYFLTIDLNYTTNAVSVGELIGYPNRTGVPLSALVLAVEPNLFASGFLLDSLDVDGQPSSYTLAGGRLDIPLAAPLQPGASVTIGLNYRLVLPYAGSANIYGYNTLQVNLLDWYPYVVPYDPILGWRIHDKVAVGEHLAYDLADFDVTLFLDDPSLVVAAGAPAEWNGRGWHYRLTGRSFALSISDSYQMASTAAGDVTVTVYSFASESAAANLLLQEVAKAVVTYSEYFGPYPYTTLSIVEAAAYGDGMEVDGLFFLGRKFFQACNNSPQCDMVALGIHEAAHNWWFGQVGSDQALEPWLDEALAVYSEHIFYEVNYPGLVDWWWDFRVNHYAPTGWVDNTIYNAGPFRSYVDSVYLRGADFLDALRLRIGDQAFLAFLKDYATQMSGGFATADDFFRILRQHTAVDFSDITSSFFQIPR